RVDPASAARSSKELTPPSQLQMMFELIPDSDHPDLPAYCEREHRTRAASWRSSRSRLRGRRLRKGGHAMSRVFCWAVLMSMIGGAIAPGGGLAQAPAGGASSELVGLLAKEMGSSTKQAQGAAGSIFRLAKTRMTPEDFGKVATAVPGMDGLLKAAPA